VFSWTHTFSLPPSLPLYLLLTPPSFSLLSCLPHSLSLSLFPLPFHPSLTHSLNLSPSLRPSFFPSFTIPLSLSSSLTLSLLPYIPPYFPLTFPVSNEFSAKTLKVKQTAADPRCTTDQA